MVSSKEISEMLAAKREGRHPQKDEKDEKPKEVVETGKKCPECGTLNKENAKFCVGCGKSFEEKTVKIKPVDIKDAKDTKICSSCKSEIPENAKFCVVCGETQEVSTEKQEEEIETPEAVIETKKVEVTPKFEELPTLVLSELTINEDGLKFNKKAQIEGLNEGTEIIKFKNIENIEFKEKSGAPVIEIGSKNGIITIKNVDPEIGEEFTAKTNEILKNREPEIDPESMDKIQKAKELFDIGAISEEEFENIKKKILNKN